MFRKQLLIFAGMMAAVAVCIVFCLYVPWGHASPPPADTADRLAYALRWLLVPGLALFVGIGFTASRRFFVADAIDGARRVEDKALEINLRYNQNTLEQLVLAAVAWLGLSLVLPVEQLGVIARMAVLFGIGRALFWAGYLYAPWARGFGMGLTSYPTFAALIYLAWTAIA